MMNMDTTSTSAKSRDREETVGRDDWILDESVEETFPASDPTSASQPGSIAAQRAAGSRWRTNGRSSAWLPLALLAGAAVAWVAIRRRA